MVSNLKPPSPQRHANRRIRRATRVGPAGQRGGAYLVSTRARRRSFLPLRPVRGPARRSHRLHPVAPAGAWSRTGRGGWGRPHATGTARRIRSAAQRPDPANGAVRRERSWPSDRESHPRAAASYICTRTRAPDGGVERIQSASGSRRQRRAGVRGGRKGGSGQGEARGRPGRRRASDGEVHAQVQGGRGRGGRRRRGHAGRRRPDEVTDSGGVGAGRRGREGRP